MEETKNKEEEAAPDSWETADLEDSVNRLFISSRKSSSPSLSPDSDAPPPPPPPPPRAAGSSPVPPSEEAIAQVDQFLREALEKPRERISVLRMEQDIERLIRNPSQMQIEFTALPTSYLRLAAHRLAQHYSLQSIAIPDPITLDGSGPGSRIIIRKINSECRLPAVRLADIPVNLPQEDTSSVPVKLAIKPRHHRNAHGSGLTGSSSRLNFQKSVEERKEEYNRARARIFSNSSSNDANSSVSSGTVSKPHEEPRLPDSLDNCGFVEPDLDEAYELASNLNSSSTVNLNSAANRGVNCSGSRNSGEKEEGGITRSRSGGARVAIFRDRDIDRKDPDYDRSYDRYVKRFDPGFGFNGGSYPLQPLYVPAVNYNTEFPQLGSAPRPPHQLSIDTPQQVRSVSPHLHGGLWSSVAHPPPQQVGQLTMPYNPSAPHEAMIAHAYNAASPISGGSAPGVRTPVYIHSPQYSVPGRPGMPVSYVASREHMQPFLQTQPQQQQQQQQQQEGSYAFARPR